MWRIYTAYPIETRQKQRRSNKALVTVPIFQKSTVMRLCRGGPLTGCMNFRGPRRRPGKSDAYLFEISRFPIDAKVLPLFLLRISCARTMNSSRTGTISASTGGSWNEGRTELTYSANYTLNYNEIRPYVLDDLFVIDRHRRQAKYGDIGMSGCISLDQISSS
jgi:hypothetical protein